MEDPSARTLDLLSLLQGGRPWSGRELATRLGVSPRTLRRDVDRLRRLGYCVESARGTDGGYRLTGGRDIPSLPLSGEEAVAAAVGLRHASAYEDDPDGPATAALHKIEQGLPSRLRARIGAVRTATAAARGGGGAGGDPAVVGLLAWATRSRSHVRFRHTGRDGRTTPRRVEPYRQVLFAHHWFLIAWDLDRAGWRAFRVDRLADPVIPGTTFRPRPVPDDAVSFPPLGGGPGADSASVLFRAPVDVVSRRLTATAGALTAVDAQCCRYTTAADDWPWLAGAVAGVGVPYVVEGPDALAAATRHLAGLAHQAAGAGS